MTVIHPSNAGTFDPAYNSMCASKKHGICWASITAGAVGTLVVSFALMVLEASFGLAAASPWSGEGLSAKAIGVNAIIAMIIMQWLSAAFGGYLAGRLRSSRCGIHTDEICFRDTAHGFLTWAVATLVMVTLLGTATASVIGGGAQAVTAGAVAGSVKEQSSNDPMNYYIDGLFRTARSTDATDESARMEVTRILAKSLSDDDMTQVDKDYVSTVIANRTGITKAEAEARLDTTVNDIKSATDAARKAAAKLAIYTFLSLLVGAFIASVAAAIGGHARDKVQIVM